MKARPYASDCMTKAPRTAPEMVPIPPAKEVPPTTAAAKGVYLQGVRAVVAEGYERIHRSNLVGMGILPLQFQPGENVASLGLSGQEEFDITGIEEDIQPGQPVAIRARAGDGTIVRFSTLARLDTPIEVEYYRNGGVLHTILRRMVREQKR